MRVSCFPWYDLPELQGAYDSLWSVVASHLRRHKVRDVPENLSRGVPLPGIFTDPTLLVGQCCGYDIIYGFAGSLSIIGWGAVRIIETPGWGKLNLNRSVAYDE